MEVILSCLTNNNKDARKNLSAENLVELTDGGSASESGTGKAIRRLADGHSLKVNGSRV